MSSWNGKTADANKLRVEAVRTEKQNLKAHFHHINEMIGHLRRIHINSQKNTHKSKE